MDVVAVPMARAVLEPKPKLVEPGRPRRAERATATGAWPCSRASRSAPPASIDAAPAAAPTRRPRALLQAELDVDGTNLTVVATHFSHLEFGSPLHAAALRRGLPPTDRPAVFVGDMNMWGWTIAAMVPKGWRRVVRGKTWPARRPAHQIDHLLVTPSVEVVRGEVLPDAGSDHRPIRAAAPGAVSGPLVFLCTGNAARSVMGGAALAAHLPDWHVSTAGTLVVEGQPMSWRTKAALDAVGLARRTTAAGRRPRRSCAMLRS